MTISLPKTKQKCSDCSQTKPVNGFFKKGKNSKGIQLYQSYCKPCANKRRRLREKNDPLFKEKRKKYMGKANSKRTPEQRKKEPSYRNYFKDIKRQYGLTKEQYESLLASQNNACAICNKEFLGLESKRRPHIDHYHDT